MSVSITGDGPNIALTGTGSSFTITVTTGSGGGVTDHGELTGLSDNDHPQYALSASLGDAALLDVGTTAGTVAAGDDSRITGAVQGDGITDAVLLTQAEYDAIGSPDASTLYVVVG